MASDAQPPRSVYVVLDINDFPVAVAASKGRALELMRARPGRSLTWCEFDAQLGPGETAVVAAPEPVGATHHDDGVRVSGLGTCSKCDDHNDACVCSQACACGGPHRDRSTTQAEGCP